MKTEILITLRTWAGSIDLLTGGVCQGAEGPCEETECVLIQDCRTAYSDSSQNRMYWLCPTCAETYHSYWDDMWSEFNYDRY